MRKIIVQEFITLDGVMQAPGTSDEDTASGFKFMAEWMKSTDILLGRITFDMFARYWPQHADIWPGIQDVTKYVMSSRLTENKTDWKNVVFLSSVDDIKKLKDSEGSDIKVHGSSDLAQTLFKHDLVDELRLRIFPITLGTGKRLFGEGTIAAAFKLTDSLVASSGVIFANYKRAGQVKTGNIGEQ
jgi:dihydrofolate reductase